ncbi:hypothetical protein FJZ26_00090 [Candidatus Parvarchaeota archaeon]|nr:hypothetical protein [Candidatus Parvarchaeota archaeon]
MECFSLVEKTEDYRLYRLANPSMPQRTFIVCSQAARDVLYKPHLAGKPLQDAMNKNASIFARLLKKHVVNGAKLENVCELVFLSGGLYYFLNAGFKSEFGVALPQCFIGIQRQRIEGAGGQFRAIAGYENFESLPDNAHVIIGDTIATGSTLVKGIQMLLDAAESKGTKIASITVITLAGSPQGAQKLAALEKSHILPQHPSCKVNLFACEMLFHLMPDGTDLRFLEKDSIMPDESREYAKATYGDWLGKNMKCAVFDWGTRCKNPAAHYSEFLEFVQQAIKDKKTPADARSRLEEMKKEALSGIERMKKEL